VDAGSVLGDICNVGERGAHPITSESPLANCVVHLTHSYRFGADSSLGELARAINENRPDEALDLLTSGSDSSALRLVDEADPQVQEQLVASAAAERYRGLLTEPDPLDRLRRLGAFRVLCAHRRGPAGSARIGRAVEELLTSRGAISTAGEWYDGRPVLVTSNDYQLDLWNGDTGLTCLDRDSGRLEVCFPTADAGLRPINPSRLVRYETAFATTVHKAQGSEFDEVAVVLPPRISPVVTRELLYTAVTRARQRVTVYGTRELVAAAIRARTVRFSGLRDLLWS
jgi:exodeoxyribonuclease V alpha subunit